MCPSIGQLGHLFRAPQGYNQGESWAAFSSEGSVGEEFASKLFQGVSTLHFLSAAERRAPVAYLSWVEAALSS